MKVRVRQGKGKCAPLRVSHAGREFVVYMIHAFLVQRDGEELMESCRVHSNERIITCGIRKL